MPSAGNNRRRHYEGEFVDGGDDFHAFNGRHDISMRETYAAGTYPAVTLGLQYWCNGLPAWCRDSLRVAQTLDSFFTGDEQHGAETKFEGFLARGVVT